MSGWTWAWLAWLAAFGVIEGKALANKRDGDTLSEHVWKWFGTARKAADGSEAGQPTGWVRLRRFGLLAGVCWLLAHFLSGGYF